MDKSSTRELLLQILNDNSLFIANDGNSIRLSNLIRLSQLEIPIPDDCGSLLSQALIRSIPKRLGPSRNLYPDRDDKKSEQVLQATKVLTSPIMLSISKKKREELVKGVMWHVNDTLCSSWDDVPAHLPSNFSLMKEVFKNPPLMDLYLGINEPYNNQVITWALANDLSLLQYFPARDFQITSSASSYRIKYRNFLNTYLQEVDINHELFWDMVHEVPDISALSLL